MGPNGAILAPGTDSQGSGESFPIIDTPGGVVVGVGLLVDHTDGVNSLCGDAGMLNGADYLTRSPGAVASGCGKFNVPPELDPADGEAFFQHIVSGALSARVVV
jgi:hypothetical protein